MISNQKGLAIKRTPNIEPRKAKRPPVFRSSPATEGGNSDPPRPGGDPPLPAAVPPPRRDEIKAYALEAEQILERLDAYQDVVTSLAEEIKQDGLITAEELSQVAAANQTVDDLQGCLAEIAAAIGNAPFSDDNTLTNTPVALQAANTAAGGDYPYSGQVSARPRGPDRPGGILGPGPVRQTQEGRDRHGRDRQVDRQGGGGRGLEALRRQAGSGDRAGRVGYSGGVRKEEG